MKSKAKNEISASVKTRTNRISIMTERDQIKVTIIARTIVLKENEHNIEGEHMSSNHRILATATEYTEQRKLLEVLAEQSLRLYYQLC